MKTTPPKKLTQSAIAEQAGISRQTLSSWKREGMDTSPENLEAVVERADLSQATGEISELILAARLRKLNAEADSKEFQLETEKGRWMLKSDAIAAAGVMAYASREQWERIENSLPPILEGKTAAQMASKLRGYIFDVLTDLSHIFDIEDDDDSDLG